MHPCILGENKLEQQVPWCRGAVVPGDGKQSDRWSSQDKCRVVLETASLNEAELAEYCRRKGLYVEPVTAWRESCEQANSLAPPAKIRREREKEKATNKRIKQLSSSLSVSYGTKTQRWRKRLLCWCWEKAEAL